MERGTNSKRSSVIFLYIFRRKCPIVDAIDVVSSPMQSAFVPKSIRPQMKIF
jgi:hypothetical protein